MNDFLLNSDFRVARNGALLNNIGVVNLNYSDSSYGSITFCGNDFETILGFVGNVIELANVHTKKTWAKVRIKKLTYGDVDNLVALRPEEVEALEFNLTFDCEFVYCEFFGIKEYAPLGYAVSSDPGDILRYFKNG